MFWVSPDKYDVSVQQGRSRLYLNGVCEGINLERCVHANAILNVHCYVRAHGFLESCSRDGNRIRSEAV
jgi:hypothetical protein